jgi:hypothetical protein
METDVGNEDRIGILREVERHKELWESVRVVGEALNGELPPSV